MSGWFGMGGMSLDKITKKTEVDGMDVAREVTESNPGSPLNYPNDN